MMMTMQGDDVWRIIEMTIILGPLMYYSVVWLANARHLGSKSRAK